MVTATTLVDLHKNLLNQNSATFLATLIQITATIIAIIAGFGIPKFREDNEKYIQAESRLKALDLQYMAESEMYENMSKAFYDSLDLQFVKDFVRFRMECGIHLDDESRDALYSKLNGLWPEITKEEIEKLERILWDAVALLQEKFASYEFPQPDSNQLKNLGISLKPREEAIYLLALIFIRRHRIISNPVVNDEKLEAFRNSLDELKLNHEAKKNSQEFDSEKFREISETVGNYKKMRLELVSSLRSLEVKDNPKHLILSLVVMVLAGIVLPSFYLEFSESFTGVNSRITFFVLLIIVLSCFAWYIFKVYKPIKERKKK